MFRTAMDSLRGEVHYLVGRAVCDQDVHFGGDLIPQHFVVLFVVFKCIPHIVRSVRRPKDRQAFDDDSRVF